MRAERRRRATATRVVPLRVAFRDGFLAPSSPRATARRRELRPPCVNAGRIFVAIRRPTPSRRRRPASSRPAARRPRASSTATSKRHSSRRRSSARRSRVHVTRSRHFRGANLEATSMLVAASRPDTRVERRLRGIRRRLRRRRRIDSRRRNRRVAGRRADRIVDISVRGGRRRRVGDAPSWRASSRRRPRRTRRIRRTSTKRVASERENVVGDARGGDARLRVVARDARARARRRARAHRRRRGTGGANGRARDDPRARRADADSRDENVRRGATTTARFATSDVVVAAPSRRPPRRRRRARRPRLRSRVGSGRWGRFRRDAGLTWARRRARRRSAAPVAVGVRLGAAACVLGADDGIGGRDGGRRRAERRVARDASRRRRRRRRGRSARVVPRRDVGVDDALALGASARRRCAAISASSDAGCVVGTTDLRARVRRPSPRTETSPSRAIRAVRAHTRARRARGCVVGAVGDARERRRRRVALGRARDGRRGGGVVRRGDRRGQGRRGRRRQASTRAVSSALVSFEPPACAIGSGTLALAVGRGGGADVVVDATLATTFLPEAFVFDARAGALELALAKRPSRARRRRPRRRFVRMAG